MLRNRVIAILFLLVMFLLVPAVSAQDQPENMHMNPVRWDLAHQDRIIQIVWVQNVLTPFIESYTHPESPVMTLDETTGNITVVYGAGKTYTLLIQHKWGGIYSFNEFPCHQVRELFELLEAEYELALTDAAESYDAYGFFPVAACYTKSPGISYGDGLNGRTATIIFEGSNGDSYWGAENMAPIIAPLTTESRVQVRFFIRALQQYYAREAREFPVLEPGDTAEASVLPFIFEAEGVRWVANVCLEQPTELCFYNQHEQDIFDQGGYWYNTEVFTSPSTAHPFAAVWDGEKAIITYVDGRG